MLDLILIFKFVHVLAAAAMFGTWLALVLFMQLAHRSGNPSVIALTARFVVHTETMVMIAAVALQPLSGFALAWAIGLAPLDEFWIVLSLILYVVVGLCWLPVVFIQIRMRNLAQDAAVNTKPLPDAYRRLFRIWFVLGWPAFAGVIAIFALMIWQPH